MLKVNRTAYRYVPVKLPDEDSIRAKIIYYACNYGHVGYRMITWVLRNDGIEINHKRVERIWKEEGLQVPKKQKKRRRVWMNDGSCIRLRPLHENHVWSYDFIEDKTANGRKFRILNILDEKSRKCIASVAKRKWTGLDVIEVLADAMMKNGCPEYIRSDNGSEFTASIVKEWLESVSVITAYIEPGSPWENGYIESFNSRMRAEFLSREIFDSMYEVEVLLNRWVEYYNNVRPHSSLGGKPPAPQSYLLAAKCTEI